jgi:glycosyltransferase involved in cell wall biosynthesis
MPEMGPSAMMLSVVMPVYNEEASIRCVVVEHVDVLRRLNPPVDSWEIVCVDDGSKDATPAILEELQKEVPELRVVRQKNQGIFQAFTRAYNEARGTHVYGTGSDGQWPAENMIPMLAEVRAGAHLVVGVRTNRRQVYALSRRLVSRAFNVLPRLLFGVRVEDAGSVKLGVREIFQLKLISSSAFFEAERIIRAHKMGYRVSFVPIQFLTRSGGKATGASLKNVTSSMRDLIRFWHAFRFRRELQRPVSR